MKRFFYLFIVFTLTKSFGQNECRICDSLQHSQRQTGNRETSDKYKSTCLKRDTLFSNTTFIVTTKAICSDFISYETFNSESRIPISGFRIENKDTIFFDLVDKTPVYQNGEAEMLKFISKNIIYPKICLDKKIQGKVYITFVIDENGNMKDVYPLLSPDPDLTNESIRVVKLLHSWTPGKVNGRAIKFQYILPIKFTL